MKIGLLGFGVVGRGVWNVFSQKKFADLGIEIKRIAVKDLAENPEDVANGLPITDNAYDVLNDEEISLVVECIGGVNLAREFIKYAMEHKKHVVTSNKAVIAACMEELFQVARDNDVSLLFEASVGGGMPLIKPLKQASQTDHFHSIYGIFNGTSNFILTKMSRDGLSFDEALKLAQELGFAEADPTDDIDGMDLARKLSILASTIIGKNLPVSAFSIFGIRNIHIDDMRYVQQFGLNIKLVAQVEEVGEGYRASVEPLIIDNSSMLAQVHDAYNSGFAEGNYLERVAFYGEGAGREATANAVASDILDIVNNDYLAKMDHCNVDFAPIPVEGFDSRYYFRIDTDDENGLNSLFATNGVKADLFDHPHGRYVTEHISAKQANALTQALQDQNISHFRARMQKGSFEHIL